MTPINRIKLPLSPEQEAAPEANAQPRTASGRPARVRAASARIAKARPAVAKAAAEDEGSHFELNIRVRQDEMAQWSQERLATFFEAVSVLMAAKTQSTLPPRASADPGLVNEMRTLETRLAAQFQQHQAALAEVQRTAASTLEAMRSELAAARERASAGPAAETTDGKALSHIGDSIDAVEERIRRIEQTVDGVRRHVATLHESIAEDFKSFEDNLSVHTNAIQSARTAMSQTDDLVERVVEALEVLQSSTLRPQDDQAAFN